MESIRKKQQNEESEWEKNGKAKLCQLMLEMVMWVLCYAYAMNSISEEKNELWSDFWLLHYKKPEET